MDVLRNETEEKFLRRLNFFIQNQRSKKVRSHRILDNIQDAIRRRLIKHKKGQIPKNDE